MSNEPRCIVYCVLCSVYSVPVHIAQNTWLIRYVSHLSWSSFSQLRFSFLSWFHYFKPDTKANVIRRTAPKTNWMWIYTVSSLFAWYYLLPSDCISPKIERDTAYAWQSVEKMWSVQRRQKKRTSTTETNVNKWPKLLLFLCLPAHGLQILMNWRKMRNICINHIYISHIPRWDGIRLWFMV